MKTNIEAFSLEGIDINTVVQVPENIDAKIRRSLNIGIKFGIIWVNGNPEYIDINNNIVLSKS